MIFLVNGIYKYESFNIYLPGILVAFIAAQAEKYDVLH